MNWNNEKRFKPERFSWTTDVSAGPKEMLLLPDDETILLEELTTRSAFKLATTPLTDTAGVLPFPRTIYRRR